jgi:hypothetical protein
LRKSNFVIITTLTSYFIGLSERITQDGEIASVDFDLLEEKLNSGIEIDAVDKFGQSCMHEVARVWHVDVARFMLSKGERASVRVYF